MKKVWIDCDPGIDDMLALLYALKHPDIEVMGISVVAGNVPVEQGVLNVLKLLSYLDIDVPVYKGYTSKTYHDARDTHGSNGIGCIFMPTSEKYYKKVISTKLEAGLHDVVKQYPGEVHLVCLGPLTNIFQYLRKYPLDLENIKEINIMGGCYEYPGNCSPVSEYNFWCDSESMRMLFENFSYSNKFKLVTLEVTHRIILNENLLKRIETENAEIGKFVRDITQFYIQFHKMQEGIDGCVINDPLVLVDIMNPGLVTYKDYYVKGVSLLDSMCLSAATCEGQLIVDRKNFYRQMPNASVSTSIQFPTNFWNDFIQIITK